jgi:hypothetical protein
LKLLAGDATQTEALPEVVQAPDEADVSFSTFDLNDVSLAPSQALLSADEIQAQVNAFMKSAASGLRSPMPIPPQLLLMRTSRAAFDLNGAMPMGSADTTLMSAPFSNIQVRMVPENVSLIAKTDAPEAEKIAIEKLVIVRRNERLGARGEDGRGEGTIHGDVRREVVLQVVDGAPVGLDRVRLVVFRA